MQRVRGSILTAESIAILGSGVAVDGRRKYVSVRSTDSGLEVVAHDLVGAIAVETGIPFAEVSEEDAAILELHRLARDQKHRFEQSMQGEFCWVYPETRGTVTYAPTAVELLAKVREAMRPKRTREQILAEFPEVLGAILEASGNWTTRDFERGKLLLIELAEAEGA